MIVDKILAYLDQEEIVMEDWIARQYGYMAEYSMKRQFAKRVDGPALRFSGAGKCARALSYEFHGYDANGKEQNSRSKLVFLYGDLLEALIVSLAKASGVQITACGLDQKKISLTVDGVEINGHPDGLIIGNPIHTFECKSMSDYGYQEFERGEISKDYLVQVNLGMEAMGLEKCVFVAINKQSGVMGERILTKDAALVKFGVDNLTSVLHSDFMELAPRAYEPTEKGFYPWNCDYCKFHTTCLIETGLAEKVVVKNAYKLKALEVPHV